MQKLRVIFRGNVQGVGFRYRTFDTAKGRPIVGFVQNLPDRTVLLVAEGVKSDLKDFLDAILREMDGFVREHDLSWLEPSGDYNDFEVRH